MQKQLFGTLNLGEEIYIYTLQNDDAIVKIMNFGATIVQFKPFSTSIVGGFDTLNDYLADTSHQGALIGRVANRIANATLTMDGNTYHLPMNNNGKHCLHGGEGFDRKLFTVDNVTDNSITLSYTAQDGEEGFPARLHVCIKYTLIGASLLMEYTATPEGKTPIVLTNHSYFNLDGFGGTVLNHTMQIFADRYTEVNDELIPTGNRPQVQGTVYNLNTPTKLGDRIQGNFKGYDTFFHANPKTFACFAGENLGLVAQADNGKLKLKVYTDQPGLQFYSATMMQGGPNFSGNIKKQLYGAFCLETHTEPNCVAHGKAWYDVGETYKQTTVYAVEKM